MAGTLTQDKIKNVFQKIIFYLDSKLYHTSSDNNNDELVTSINNDISFGGTLTGASFDAKEDNITRTDSTSTTSSTIVATATGVKTAYDRAWEPIKGGDDNYVTDAEKTVIANTSGVNSGNNAANSLYSGLVSNVTHSGDATGATELTIKNDVALAGNPTTTTQSASNNSTRIATTAYTDAQVATIVDSAPATLDTLNELAAALGDDANYATTTATAIGLKAPIASPTFTGTIAIPNIANLETAVTANTAKGLTSGTAAPTSVSDKTPNNGDIYVRYADGDGDGSLNTALDTGDDHVKLYIRDSDERLLVIEPTSSSNAELRMKEAIDSATAPANPLVTDIEITNVSGTNIYGKKLVGYSIDIYATCTYNGDVSGSLDNTPRCYFSGSALTNTYKDFDGTNNTKTTSAQAIASNARDEYVQAQWIGTTTAGANITEGGADVGGSVGDTINFRNLVIWGSCTGNTDAAILVGIDARAGTSPGENSNGGSDWGTTGVTGYICQFSYTTTGLYASDQPTLDREWTIPAGSYFLIAYPENNQNNISSIILDGFQGDYASDCSTGTVTYENDLGFSESYRYHISNEIFNGSTDIKMTKAR